MKAMICGFEFEIARTSLDCCLKRLLSGRHSHDAMVATFGSLRCVGNLKQAENMAKAGNNFHSVPNVFESHLPEINSRPTSAALTYVSCRFPEVMRMPLPNLYC
jgi:hypothetical protein